MPTCVTSWSRRRIWPTTSPITHHRNDHIYNNLAKARISKLESLCSKRTSHKQKIKAFKEDLELCEFMAASLAEHKRSLKQDTRALRVDTRKLEENTRALREKRESLRTEMEELRKSENERFSALDSLAREMEGENDNRNADAGADADTEDAL